MAQGVMADMRPKVLILDFDFFTSVGGGQVFYRRVVERNPGTDFLYPSRGPDLRPEVRNRLPGNAHPFAFDRHLDVGFVAEVFDTLHWIDRHYANEVARVAVAVQGMTFLAVDVPSFFPAAHMVRPVMTALGITVDCVALGLAGWPSMSARNSYDGEVGAEVLAALGQAEDASVAAADVRYTVSEAEIAVNATVTLPITLIDMHDAIESVPVPAPQVPGDGPPDLWFVGRLDGAKGPDLFIELAARMPRHLYGACFLAGPDNDWAEKEQRWSRTVLDLAAARKVDARYVGCFTDPEILRERVYGGRSVVVVPSRNDAFNYVSLEAVLNGCPTLLSLRTGASGFLRDRHPHLMPPVMDPDDLDAAAATLRRMLETYPQAALALRRTLRETPFPRPRPGFMTRIYEAPPARSPAMQETSGERAVAMRGRIPLLEPAVRNWRPVRPAPARPRVTVVIPTLDRPALLAPTLSGLTRQTFDALEVIVVDDGSRDAATVRAVVESFAPMARLLRIGNAGEAGAVNRGIAEARGEFVGILSDDDAYTPELLARAVDALDADPAAVGVYPDWDIVDGMGHIVERHRLPDYDRRLMLCAHWCLPGPGTVVRRSALAATGGRDLSFRFVSDFDLWLRVSALGHFIHLPHRLALWRLHGTNLTTSGRRREMAEERIRLMERFFRNPEERGWSAADRDTAWAAAHLAAAATLGGDGAGPALQHLARAAALAPDLLDDLPANMAGYPDAWPEGYAEALAMSVTPPQDAHPESMDAPGFPPAVAGPDGAVFGLFRPTRENGR